LNLFCCCNFNFFFKVYIFLKLSCFTLLDGDVSQGTCAGFFADAYIYIYIEFPHRPPAIYLYIFCRLETILQKKIYRIFTNEWGLEWEGAVFVNIRQMKPKLPGRSSDQASPSKSTNTQYFFTF